MCPDDRSTPGIPQREGRLQPFPVLLGAKRVHSKEKNCLRRDAEGNPRPSPRADRLADGLGQLLLKHLCDGGVFLRGSQVSYLAWIVRPVIELRTAG